MIHYELFNATERKVDKAPIEAGLTAADKKLKNIGDRHVVVEIVTLQESKKLNKQLRDKDEPTDILSISSLDTRVGEQVITEKKDGSLDFTLKQDTSIEHEWPVLGQLVVCLDIVEANAKRAGQPLERELKWVIEHGTLHLLGFHHDHDK